jgi:hypothetical protein
MLSIITMILFLQICVNMRSWMVQCEFLILSKDGKLTSYYQKLIYARYVKKCLPFMKHENL